MDQYIWYYHNSEAEAAEMKPVHAVALLRGSWIRAVRCFSAVPDVPEPPTPARGTLGRGKGRGKAKGSQRETMTWSEAKWGDAETRAQDEECGFRVSSDFRRMSQKDDIFCRSFWDEEVRSKRSQRMWEGFRPLSMGGQPWKGRKAEGGFGHRDYAVRNASWHVMDMIAELKEDEDRREGFLDAFTVLDDGPSDPTDRVDFGSPSDAARVVKQVARMFGADDVRHTGRDERWHYTTAYSRSKSQEKESPVPAGLDHCIVIITAMDRELLHTVPSALSEAAAGLGYGWDTVALLSLSQFIRNAGYQAVPSLNDTALAIPYAVKAGLGEYGRNGLLIHPDYGPRVRIGKVFTDLPVAHDPPKTFGVTEFCQQCDRCTKGCPAKAISAAPKPRTPEWHNRSNLVGVSKWTTNAEKCFRYWTTTNAACSVCIRVCPYNRGDAPADRLWRKAATVPALQAAALAYDDFTGRAKRLLPASWWGDAATAAARPR